MAKLKTKRTSAAPAEFLASIADDEQRADCLALAKMMQAASKSEPRMWGKDMVGFGTYVHRSAGGRESEWMKVGFSPRKGTLSIYIIAGLNDSPDLLKKLGKVKTGASCLYVKRLADVHLPTLKVLIAGSIKRLSVSPGK